MQFQALDHLAKHIGRIREFHHHAGILTFRWDRALGSLELSSAQKEELTREAMHAVSCASAFS